MPDKLLVMTNKKTEQVRIPADLAEDARIVASSFGKTLPEYVTEVVEQAVKKDLPRAAKIVQRKASRERPSGELEE